MDIYDGADWTEMDIDDLKAAIESGRSSYFGSVEITVSAGLGTGNPFVLKRQVCGNPPTAPQPAWQCPQMFSFTHRYRDARGLAGAFPSGALVGT